VRDDVYAAANTVTILGTVEGDVVAVANTVNIAGKVNGTLLVAGNNVSISGEVNGTVRAAGGMVTINGRVTRDVVAAGGTVTLSESARIERDVWLAGGSISLGSQVGRDARISAGAVTLSGTVQGNAEVQADSLKLTGPALVAGNLKLTGPSEPVIETGAQVRGQTIFEESTSIEATGAQSARKPLETVVDWTRGVIGLSIFAVAFVLLLPGLSRRAAERIEAKPWHSLGLGAAALAITPFAALLLLGLGALLGGWWLGPLLLLLLVPLTLAGYATSARYIGEWTAQRLERPHLPIGLKVTAGVVILALPGFVPVLGFIVGLTAILFGLGAILAAAAPGGQPSPGPQPSVQPAVQPA
jgi:cytoskeletal protein CcmA (bactofilin family)